MSQELLLILCMVVTLINTIIVATTRAAVSELKAELIEKLASKGDLEHLDGRVRKLETLPWKQSTG